jgi:NAD(P)-dependent dehydrogenase (short-subunit alcohol dehydrogenase family)
MKLPMQGIDIPADSLKGKTIVITGAGSGIGRQAAKSFSDFGANLILLSKDQGKLESLYDEINADNSRNIIIQPVDFEKAEEREFEEIVGAIKEEHSIIDGLLNNAGILGEKKSLEQYNFSTWTSVLQVNLHASFLLTKNLIPLLKKSNNGSIVFTSSGVGRKGKAYWGAYSISKFATEGMMQILSEEFQNTSCIRVNCINPGPVRTKMRELAYPAENPEVNPLAADIMKYYLYLMSDQSLKISGQTIDAQER